VTKYKIITKEITTKEIEDITCDKCGKSMIIDKYSTAGGKMEVGFGYGSKFDMDHYRLDICDDCWTGFYTSLTNKP
jgi:hypothetical protein